MGENLIVGELRVLVDLDGRLPTTPWHRGSYSLPLCHCAHLLVDLPELQLV
jgi:hypothetical protein